MERINAEQAWRTVLETARPERAAKPPTLTGEPTRQARQILDSLLPLARAPKDYVIAQIGQSLDGRIATHSGHSHYVTGKASRIHLHRLRALVDAVIIGADTATTDNPALTVRHVPGPSPARVVLDPHGRVPRTQRIFTDGGPATLHAVRRGASPAPGAEPLWLGPDPETGTVDQLLSRLADRGLRRVLVEGGGVTISRFMEAGRVDRLHVMVAPFLIGSGRPALQLAEIDTLDQALRPSWTSCLLGEDRLYDLDLSQRSPAVPQTSA